MSFWKPLIPGAIIKPVGVAAFLMTTRLMALMLIAWWNACLTLLSLKGFLPDPGISRLSFRHWS